MADEILKPTRRLIIVSNELSLPPHKVVKTDSGLLKASLTPDIRANAPDLKVSAYTDDPNTSAPHIERFWADEFQAQPEGKGIAGRSVKVDIEARPKDGEWIFGKGAPELAATTAYVAASGVKKIAEEYLHQPVRWGDGERLTLDSYKTKSNELNAYYSSTERKVSLGHATEAGSSWYGATPEFDPSNPVYNLAQVPEVVAHECGHAVFDAVKGYTALSLSTRSAEVRSVNEGLADGMAFLANLKHSDVIQRALVETGLDLSKPNALSDLADTVGAVFGTAGDNPDRALRSFLNTRVREPGKSYECHDGGEIVGGALYDFFLRFCQSYQARTGSGAYQSIAVAGEVTGALFLNALKFTPDDGSLGFEDYGRGLLLADLSMNQGRHLAQLKEVVLGRGLLTAEQIEATVAQFEAWRDGEVSIPRGSILDGQKALAERLLPTLREAYGLGDAQLEIHRCERDKRGFLRLVFQQPRANKAEEAALESLNKVYGEIDRDALLSQGTFTIVFDPLGQVAGVFNQIGSATNVAINGKRGDGSPSTYSDPSLYLSDDFEIGHKDNFNHLVG
ncbi:MAG TPA: hypothetical protein DFS52_32575 [Myxococcales bacterium]|jgi:hypothetical protein|nr:hypothetical protein [Myxococcales bacterium]